MKMQSPQTALFSTADTEQSSIHVIGVGGAGIKAASEIHRQRFSGVRVTCVDTDALSLDRADSDFTYLLGAATLRGFGSAGDRRAAAAAAVGQAANIERTLGGTVCVIVVGSVAGATGAGALPVIAKAIGSGNRKVISIPLLPLEIEPVSTQLAAWDALDQLNGSSDALIDLPRVSQVRSGSSPKGIGELFSAERAHIVEFARMLAVAYASPRLNRGASPGDFDGVLSGGQGVSFGCGTGFGHTGAVEATRASLDQIAETSNVARATVLIESGPEITVSHLATITSIIEERVGESCQLRFAIHRSRLTGNGLRVSFTGTSQVSEFSHRVLSTVTRPEPTPPSPQRRGALVAG